MIPGASDAAARNLATHATWVQARAVGMRARVGERLSMGDSGLPTDSFSLVCAARLGARSAAADVEEAIAWYGDRPFSWWCAPGDRPAELATLLAGAGLELAETETAMACDLADLADGARLPDGLTVTRVATRDDLDLFAGLLAALAHPPDRAVVDFYRAAAPHVLDETCPLRFFLGRSGGRAIATAELCVSHGAAGLYNVSTVEAERRRGVGTAMTLVPLLEARREGIRLSVLPAAQDAVGVYERVGFRGFGLIREYKPRRTGASGA